MSDAITDLNRDARRSQYYGEYLEALDACLQDPTSEERADDVIRAAERVDSVWGGYLSSRTNLSENLTETLLLLQRGDEEAWAKLLNSLEGTDYHDKLIVHSPFTD